MYQIKGVSKTTVYLKKNVKIAFFFEYSIDKNTIYIYIYICI